LNSDLKISDLQISPTGPLKLELNLLCLIAEKIFDVALVNIDQRTVFTLATLLLGMIKSYTSSKKVRIEEDWVINIFRTYRTLLPNLIDVTGHVPFVSRLFGPTQESHSLFNAQSVRHMLLSIYIELSHHKSIRPKLDNCRVVLSDLMAMDPAAIDSRDFVKTMPMLRLLSGNESLSSLNWSSVLGPLVCSNRFERSLCTAVVYELIRCMYDGELALRTSALLCLKRLVDEVICWITKTSDLEWTEVLDSVILPSMRHAIQKSQDSIKKGFLFLLSHVIQTIGSSVPVEKQFQSFHGDLVFLLDEDPEKDFFENITHIQLHRRVRALRKLGDVLSSGDQTLSTFSLSHVLLPIAMHHLFSDDFQKKDQQILSQGTIPFLSILSRKLPWSQYFGVLRVILKNLEKNESKEKLSLLALSEVLGSFHFELNANPITEISDASLIDIEYDESKHSAMLISDDDLVTATAPDQEGNDKIAGIVVNKLYPWVHSFLLKDTTDHNNNASKVVRTPIVVALTNLIRKLEPPIISEERRVGLLSNLAMNIVNTLKSRDTGARDTARESLAKMIKACGMSYLHLIFRELIHSLNEGYQRHVRNYSIRFILNELLEDYSPDTSASSFPALPSTTFQTSPFDACIPMIMHCVMDDINGESLEDRSVEGVQRNLIREAKGNKAVDILETCARCLLFRPSYAMKRTNESDSNKDELKSSIHELTSPLLSVLVECEDGIIIGRIGEGLQRVAQGLSKNSSVTSEELLLYTYSTLNPFVKSMNESQQKKFDAEGRVNTELSKSTDEDIRLELPSYFYEDDSSDDELFVGAPRASTHKSKKGNTVDGFKANTWLPSTKGILTTRKSILEERDRENKALSAVCDGASAPRLSGFDRNVSKKKSKSLVGPEINAATVAAVKYCLALLSACLRQDKLDLLDPQIVSMTTPFLPLLYRCICLSNVPPIVVLALKVISLFLSVHMKDIYLIV
jgi:U3 small nucleolar RNA-associated protein 20